MPDPMSVAKNARSALALLPALANRHACITGAAGGIAGALGRLLLGSTGPRGGKRDGLLDIMAMSAARSTGTAISRSIVRGALGGLLGGSRRR